MTYRIKPLKWEKRTGFWVAHAPFGQYMVTDDCRWVFRHLLTALFSTDAMNQRATTQEAREACQRHYEGMLSLYLEPVEEQRNAQDHQ